MINIQIINLNWIEYVWNENVYTKFEKDKDRGIYQIYGDHPVYGENTLLYIGQTKDQVYSQRLKQHGYFEKSHIHSLRRLHLSYFSKTGDINQENRLDFIDLTEKLLINAHFPAYNSQEIKDAIDKEYFKNEILIMNWGERGKLLPECSSLRYSTYFWGDEYTKIFNDV